MDLGMATETVTLQKGSKRITLRTDTTTHVTEVTSPSGAVSTEPDLEETRRYVQALLQIGWTVR